MAGDIQRAGIALDTLAVAEHAPVLHFAINRNEVSQSVSSTLIAYNGFSCNSSYVRGLVRSRRLALAFRSCLHGAVFFVVRCLVGQQPVCGHRRRHARCAMNSIYNGIGNYRC